jgi:hypothetical protein
MFWSRYQPMELRMADRRTTISEHGRIRQISRTGLGDHSGGDRLHEHCLLRTARGGSSGVGAREYFLMTYGRKGGDQARAIISAR